jgi:hypothetical protein
MFRRRLKGLLLVLTVALNLGSGPMAYAHSGPTDDSGAAPAIEHCGDHASSAADENTAPAHPEQTCCAAGHCACSAASSVVPAGAPALVQFIRQLRASDLRLSEPPSASLSDPLRPPIV